MQSTLLKKSKSIKSTLIAPCGLNCRLCHAYIRNKNVCPGCRGDDSLKSKYCVTCKIKNCAQLSEGNTKHCFSCNDFPYENLKHLDKRYKTKYGLSVIENLEDIKQFGIRHFVRNEKDRWACPKCAELLCVHKGHCLSCGHNWR